MVARRVMVAVLASVVVAGGVGCKNKKPINFNQELPPGQLALRKITPAEYPDFSVNHTALQDLAKSLDNSAKYLKAPSSKQFFPYLDISHDRAAATVVAMRALVAQEMAQGFSGSHSTLR